MKYNKEGWCASRVIAMTIVAITKTHNAELKCYGNCVALLTYHHKYYVFRWECTDDVDTNLLIGKKVYYRKIAWESAPKMQNPQLRRVYYEHESGRYVYVHGQYPDAFAQADYDTLPFEKVDVASPNDLGAIIYEAEMSARSDTSD